MTTPPDQRDAHARLHDAPHAWWEPLASTRWSVPALVLAFTAARLVWMIAFSRYTLIEDEAHYWDWSRHPALSYYSKGPGVAWVIAASTALFGHVEWAVRLPAVLASAVGSLAAAGLARELFDGRATPFVAAALYQCVPAFAVASMLMTIDSPYLACWTLGAWAGARALARDDRLAWPLLGLAVALGFLFKYTILLLPLGVVLAGFCSPFRSRLRPRSLLGAAAVASLGLLPVIAWNATRGWPTVRHLLGHLGFAGGDATTTPDPWSPLWTPEYLALLLLAGGPVLWLALLAPLERRRAGIGVRFCLLLGAPVALMYLAVSLVTRVEGNWAIAAVATAAPPAAWLVVDGVRRRDLAVRALWGAALAVGLGAAVGFAALPVLASVGELGKRLPVQRLTGLRDHAHAVQRTLDALRAQTGREPFVLTEHYGRAGQLAFYLPGHPTVYCASSLVGGRTTQYDHWAHTDLDDPRVLDHLRGRPALLLGGRADQWAYAFDPVFDLGPLRAEPKANRTAYAGYDFTSFAGWRHGWARGQPPVRPLPNPQAPPAPPETAP